MNSHHQVPHCTAVANSQPRQAPWRTVADWLSATNTAAIAANCNHHSG